MDHLITTTNSDNVVQFFLVLLPLPFRAADARASRSFPPFARSLFRRSSERERRAQGVHGFLQHPTRVGGLGILSAALVCDPPNPRGLGVPLLFVRRGEQRHSVVRGDRRVPQRLSAAGEKIRHVSQAGKENDALGDALQGHQAERGPDRAGRGHGGRRVHFFCDSD